MVITDLEDDLAAIAESTGKGTDDEQHPEGSRSALNELASDRYSNGPGTPCPISTKRLSGFATATTAAVNVSARRFSPNG